MKKYKLLFALPLLCIAACNNNISSSSSSSSSSTYSTDDLVSALEAIGDNYTVSGTDFSSTPFLTKVTETTIYYDLLFETNGYVRLASDKNTIHWYKKVIEEKHNNPDYWEISGRRDVTDAEFDTLRLLDEMIDVSSFSFNDGKFHSNDKQTTQNLMALTSHVSLFFGYGDGGVNIYLENNALSKIEILGCGPEDITNTEVYATLNFSNIGTTVNEVIDDFLLNGTLPAPTFSDLIQVDREGTPLYEGETHTLDCLITGIYGGSAESVAVTDLDFICSFFVEDGSVLDGWSNYLKPMNIDATITKSDKGYATLSNINVNSVSSDEYDYDSWTVDAGFFEEEISLFPSLTGTPVSTSLTYVSGTVEEEGEAVLKFKYNELYPVDVVISETSEDVRWNMIDFLEGESIVEGDVIDFTNLIAHWNVDKMEYLISETAGTDAFKKALTPEETVFAAFGYNVPLPSINDGYDFMWKSIYSVNGQEYNGIFAKPYIKEADIDAFVESYEKDLTDNGYTLDGTDVDDAGDRFYQYLRDDMGTLVRFYEPLRMEYDNGTYYYFSLIDIVDLTTPIVNEE